MRSPTQEARAIQRKPALGYRPELDVVRFLAFLLVFVHHHLPRDPASPMPARLIPLANPLSRHVLTSFANACGMGLCLFFTLSAYLITDLLLNEREVHGVISIRKFYIRRALRIWPLYVFGIAIGIAVALAKHQPQQVHAFAWYLFFVGNVYCAAFGWFGSPMTPLWSISIEEQFYLVWPWAMRWLSRRGLVASALVFILVSNVTLYHLGRRHANTDFTVWANTFVQFEMFAAGILLAVADMKKAGIHAMTGCALAITGPLLWFIACFAFRVKEPGTSGLARSGVILMLGYGFIAMGCAAFLLGFSLMGPSRMPKWAAGLGKISYGLYVYHLLAGTILSAILQRLPFVPNRGVVIPFELLLAILMAKLSYAWLESPFLRLKRRYEIGGMTYEIGAAIPGPRN